MTGFVPYSSRDGYQLNNVPGQHLRKIGRMSKRHDTSYANVVGQVLADRYQIPFTPSTRPRVSLYKFGTAISLRLPGELMNAVRAEAEQENLTIRSVILNALSDAFKLKRPAQTHLAGKRPGRRKGT